MRRLLVTGLVSACAATTLTAAQPAYPASGTCWVENRTQGTSYAPDAGPALQQALTDSASSDLIVVSGRCVGNYVVDDWVSLRGERRPGFPRATLNGNRSGPVLTIDGDYWTEVEIRDLRLTRGEVSSSYDGGGVHVANYGAARIRLAGRTRIDNNLGAGVSGMGELDLAMSQRSRIDRNSSSGIASINGLIKMTDASRITRNGSAETWGGGILLLDGHLFMSRRAAITHNVAQLGGGIAGDSETSWLTMTGASRIAYNHADYGGGIQTQCQLIGENFSGRPAITNNTASVEGGGVWGLNPNEPGNDLTPDTVYGNAPDDFYRPSDDEECYLSPL